MKPQFDALTWYVMDATADDWESIAQVTSNVEQDLGPQDPNEIKKTVMKLFDEGLFEMMPLKGLTLECLHTDFERCWFSMTKEGRKLWDQDGHFYRNNKPNMSGAENPIPSGTSNAKASGVPDSRGL